MILRKSELPAADHPEVESPALLDGGDESVHTVLKAIELELMNDENSLDGLVDLSKSLEPTESVDKEVLDETQDSLEDLTEVPDISNTVEGLQIEDGKKIFAQEETNLQLLKSPKSSKGQCRMPELRSTKCVQIGDLKLKLVLYSGRMEKGTSDESLECKDANQDKSWSEINEAVTRTDLKAMSSCDVVDSKMDKVGYGRSIHHKGIDRKRKTYYPGNDAALRGKHLSLVPFGGSARDKVRETLCLFQAVTRKLLQEAETKPNKERHYRIDQQAALILKNKGKYTNNTGKPILGPVPGVEVGDKFHYRVELMIIGLHRPPQSGIDYVKEGGQVLATSVVDSGGYDNKVDNYDLWTYTGQGGGCSTSKDNFHEDQKLERGNLALKNSIREKNSVRVIRGVKDPKASSRGKHKVATIYTYCGLYTVERYWQEVGRDGKKDYKFELKRLPGQPELAWKEVKRAKKHEIREGCCANDISKGKEQSPICAINILDGEKPPAFTYISRMIYPKWCNLVRPLGCDCKNGCSNATQCSCAVKNGGGIPYNFDGAIVEPKPLVFECGPSCKCPPSCYNRVNQNGVKFPLEIFKTESRGWGIRSLHSIRSGSFVCEYIGELLEDSVAEQRIGKDEYLFDIGRNYNDESLWESLAGLLPDETSNSLQIGADVGFTIDAAKYGNVGRFINHSCLPNLYAQDVLYEHGDKRIPHVMFFAAENIPPLKELTYHYNYKIGQIYDQDGNVKVKYCYCGSSNCSGRMY